MPWRKAFLFSLLQYFWTSYQNQTFHGWSLISLWQMCWTQSQTPAHWELGLEHENMISQAWGPQQACTFGLSLLGCVSRRSSSLRVFKVGCIMTLKDNNKIVNRCCVWIWGGKKKLFIMSRILLNRGVQMVYKQAKSSNTLKKKVRKHTNSYIIILRISKMGVPRLWYVGY